MDSSSAKSHHQEMSSSQTLESMLINPTKLPQPEKKPKPADQQAQKCPRCESTNTKFCYYNNYSLSQPRYFCKSCRRYWTKGGTLRNVPVGGGCRKNKRSSSSTSKKIHLHHHHQSIPRSIPSPINPNSYNSPNLSYDNNVMGLDEPGIPIPGINPNMPLISSDCGVFEGLRGGFQNLCYGIEGGLEINGGIGNIGIGIGIGGLSQEMGLMGFLDHEEVSGATVIKQEIMGSNVGEESSRNLWGFPWQNVGGDGNMGEFDFTKVGSNWNGIGSSNLHGLLNSPLM